MVLDEVSYVDAGVCSGFQNLRINRLEALHHVVLDGNKQGRQDTWAYQRCASGQDSRYGFNAILMSDNCILEGNEFTNSHGVPFRSSRGTLTSLAPVIVYRARRRLTFAAKTPIRRHGICLPARIGVAIFLIGLSKEIDTAP